MENATSYISRQDSHGTHGWQVRKPATAVTGTRFFSDRKFGGKEAAYIAAVAARDEMLKSDGVVFLPTAKSKHSKNSSKIVGVTWVQDERRGKRGGAWLCHWSEGGVQRKKTFNASKYGFIEAWEMAVKTRERHSDVKPSQSQMAEARNECLRRFMEWL